MKKKLKKLFIWLFLVPLAVLVVLFMLFVYLMSKPRVRDRIQTIPSKDGRYTIQVDYVDYGGSPGIRLEIFLKRNGLFGFKKQIEIDNSLRSKLNCYPTTESNLDCPEPLETFEVKDGYLIWYGERIKL